MNTWILMFVFIHGTNSYPTVSFQEFTSKERCEAAAIKLRASMDSVNTGWKHGKTWECVPK